MKTKSVWCFCRIWYRIAKILCRSCLSICLQNKQPFLWSLFETVETYGYRNHMWRCKEIWHRLWLLVSKRSTCKKIILEYINYFCGVTDTIVWDFCWSLFQSQACNGILRFTSGATPGATLEMPILKRMARNSFYYEIRSIFLGF